MVSIYLFIYIFAIVWISDLYVCILHRMNVHQGTGSISVGKVEWFGLVCMYMYVDEVYNERT